MSGGQAQGPPAQDIGPKGLRQGIYLQVGRPQVLRVHRPRGVRLAFFAAHQIPQLTITLRATGGGWEAVRPLSEASAAQPGRWELAFPEALSPGGFEALLTAPDGASVPLFSDRHPPPAEAEALPVLARLVPLTLRYRIENEADQVPVADRYVALGLCGRDPIGGFRTDVDGAVTAGEGGPPLFVLHPEDGPGPFRVAVAREPFPDGLPPSSEVDEASVEAVWEAGEQLFVARIPRPPRVRLPLGIAGLNGASDPRAAQRFCRSHVFKTKVDGQVVACGANVAPDGRIEVVFRAPRGERTVIVTGVETTQSGPVGNMIYFAGKVPVQ